MKSTSATKTVLITGAAKRLGKAMALTFAKSGWDVAIHFGNSAHEAQATAQEIETLGRQAVLLQADLSDLEQVRNLIETCTNKLALPDCLINNASLFQYDHPQNWNTSALNQHMQVNLSAPLCLAKMMYEAHRVKNSQGVVINLLDQKLINMNPDFFSYTLSKSALHTATEMLAMSYAPQLRVVGLAPGITLVSGDQSEENFKKAHQQTPLGHSSSPEDISQAALYLAQAKSVTGTTLYVDGGQHLVSSHRDVMFLME